MQPTVLPMVPLAFGAITAPRHAPPFVDGEVFKRVAATLMNLRENLNLSEDQKKRVRDVIQSFEPEISDQFAAARAAREALRLATEKHGPKSAQARAAAEQIRDVASSRAVLAGQIMVAVRPLLTDKQLRRIESGRSEISSWIESQLSAKGL